MATNNGSGGPYDYGREMGDEQLRNVQARLKRLYSQAADDVSARLDTFLERFDAKDQLMRERVEQGLISQDEYILWRQNSILRSVQMEAQIEALTNDLVNVDELAVQMINGDIPDVYCSAYNFEGFRGETMARLEGYNYSSFSIYNANAVRIITTEDPDLIPWQEPSVDIPKDRRWNRRHIQDAITQGILAGDDMRHLSARLLPLVNMDETAAMRTARTSYIGIQNQARRDATARIVEAGIPMEETWVSVLQANTRDTHLMLHGTHPNEQGLFGDGILRHLLRFPGDPNGDAGEIYNCQCGVTSHIAGIDHSDQRDRYARFMTENYYEDWIGDKENGITGVSEYRLEETRAALERKRRLDSGEIQPRNVRRQERTAQAADGAPLFTTSMSAGDYTIEDKKWSNAERTNLDNAVNFMSSNFGDITDLTGERIYRRGSGVIGDAAGMYTRDGLTGRKEGRCIYFATSGYASEGEIIHEMTHAVTMEISSHYAELGYRHEDDVYSAMRSEVFERLGITEPSWDGRSYRQRPEEWLSYEMQNFELLSNKEQAEAAEYLMSDSRIVMTRDVIQEWFRRIGRR